MFLHFEGLRGGQRVEDYATPRRGASGLGLGPKCLLMQVATETSISWPAFGQQAPEAVGGMSSYPSSSTFKLNFSVYHLQVTLGNTGMICCFVRLPSATTAVIIVTMITAKTH